MTIREATFGSLRTEEQKQQDEEVLEQVKRGIQILDHTYGPDWPCKIDLEELDLTDYSACVLGQLYGSYSKGCEKLGVSYEGSKQYGFLPGHKATWRWNEAWEEKIDLLQSERCG